MGKVLDLVGLPVYKELDQPLRKLHIHIRPVVDGAAEQWEVARGLGVGPQMKTNISKPDNKTKRETDSKNEILHVCKNVYHLLHCL